MKINEKDVDDFFDLLKDPKSMSQEKYFEWLTRRSERGDAKSQYELSMMYLKNCDIKKEPNFFFKWINKSARQNYVPAQYELGFYYENKRDYKNAYIWYRAFVMNNNLDKVYLLKRLREYLSNEELEKSKIIARKFKCR